MSHDILKPSPKILNPFKVVNVVVTSPMPGTVSSFIVLYDTTIPEVVKTIERALNKEGFTALDMLPPEVKKDAQLG